MIASYGALVIVARNFGAPLPIAFRNQQAVSDQAWDGIASGIILGQTRNESAMMGSFQMNSTTSLILSMRGEWK
jgi:hypothetical protein